MSKERARRREERERQVAAAAAQRQAAADKQARRDARRQTLTRLRPATHSRQTGPLAERRRRQVLATAAILAVLNLLVFAVSRDPSLTALCLVASLLGAPVLYTLLFRKA